MTTPAGAPDDAALLVRLGAVASALDPVPELTYELGRSLFTLRRLDDELAELVADSLVDAGMVRAVSADVRLVTFEADGLTVEVQVVREGGRHAVLGVLSGRAAGDVTDVVLESPTAEPRTATVAGGRFAFEDVPEEIVRFRLAAGPLLRITTAWVHL